MVYFLSISDYWISHTINNGITIYSLLVSNLTWCDVLAYLIFLPSFLKGVLTAKEVYEVLRHRGWVGLFPLFTTVHDICIGRLPPKAIVEYSQRWKHRRQPKFWWFCFLYSFSYIAHCNVNVVLVSSPVQQWIETVRNLVLSISIIPFAFDEMQRLLIFKVSVSAQGKQTNITNSFYILFLFMSSIGQ